MTHARTVWGLGFTTARRGGDVLEASFRQVGSESPAPRLTGDETISAIDQRRNVETLPIRLEIDLSVAPKSTADAYLRLHALSHLLVRPNELNLEGIFGQLPNVAWTNAGPMHPSDVTASRAMLRQHGIQVQGLDKFPRLTDYVLPDGVRIADAARVRLGAYLSPGTTVMHEGFVNFNAGTLGPSMVEGRISQGVVVGAGSDIGGGASIMGTLSGGGSVQVSIGERSLLGANSGLGISLGDDCIVEAGLYITAGSKVLLVDDGLTVKARDLSGSSGLLFRRNSTNGTIEVVRREGVGVVLNDALH